jgi:spore coat polysaccharide biosynthesis predicted glycosyltransferase SpsG
MTWILEKIHSIGIKIVQVPLDSFEFEVFESFSPDLVIVDSYRIEATCISNVSEHFRVMAIVDFDTRGIKADMFLDPNFNSENLNWLDSSDSIVLAGSNFALIRNEVLAQKRNEPWHFVDETPKLLCVMGGSDPTGTIVQISKALNLVQTPFEATLIVNDKWMPQVSEIVEYNPAISLKSPTIDLPTLYGQADLVISAAGSSSWELCTIGKPSILIGVADNQHLPLKQISEANLALTLDKHVLSNSELIDAIVSNLTALLSDSNLRETISTNSMLQFDGLGIHRVVDAIEENKRHRYF